MAKLRAKRLTWAERELLKLADDLELSILKACWCFGGTPQLRAPTLHMRDAIFNYEAAKREILNDRA